MQIAKNLGLNVSRFSENALIAAIGRLQNPETRNEGNGSAEPLVRGIRFILTFKTVK
jgi:post-segregation antitoxin (ccd killing protein)